MRTMHTTASVIEAMAFRTHYPIELTADAAFLTIGDVTWIAPLEPVTK